MFLFIYWHIFSADFGLSTVVANNVHRQTVCGTPGYCGKFAT